MFEKVKKNFGFGCMRLPMVNGEVDTEEFKRMVDHFLEKGFNYFDTAHGYLDGKSETALKACLTSRYPIESYVLTDKLSGHHFETEADIRPLFQSQLDACGVEYFDFYLMHAQNKAKLEKYKACRAYETAFALKAEGKIRHVGISFHDKAEVLDEILTTYPAVEVVQIQFNYMDYEDPIVESRACYEVCRKHNKPVIVMEPVKGGKLAQMSDDALAVYKELGEMSPASYAIRFVAGHEGVMMTLSGMGNMDMMNDNISYMTDFVPFSKEEFAAVDKVREIIRETRQIPCTKCDYCAEGCPKNIPISKVFAVHNDYLAAKITKHEEKEQLAKLSGKAEDCIKCGKCENICPQKIQIRKNLEEIIKKDE